MAKKIFITGATGLLGSAIAESLLREGHTLICSKRVNSNMQASESFCNNVQWVNLDILEVDQLKEEIKDVDWVIHSAALVSFDPKDNELLDKVNRIGTKNIVDVCIENKIPNLFYVSSVAALGRAQKEATIDENTKWEDSELNSAYAISKYLAENEVWRGEQEGLNVSIINPSVILGPGDTTKSSTKLFEFTKKYKGIYPEGYLNIVDVRDVVQICTTLIKENITGERFIVNAKALSYKDFFSEMALQFGQKTPHFCFSKQRAKLAYPFFKFISFITFKPSFLTKQSIKLMGLKTVFDNKKLKNRLAFEYKDWKDTMAWVCKTLN